MKKFSLLLFLCTVMFFASAQTTKVYIVRHAEKSTENPKERDPELTVIGKERAEALTAKLANVNFDAVLSTDLKRTRETSAGVAKDNKLEMVVYNPSAPKLLADRINNEFKGKTVLIVGHSNTILELVEALGAKRPLKEVTDDDYDNLILVTIVNNEATATIEKFGVSHHSGN